MRKWNQTLPASVHTDSGGGIVGVRTSHTITGDRIYIPPFLGKHDANPSSIPYTPSFKEACRADFPSVHRVSGIMGDMAPALPDLLSEKSSTRLRAISSARKRGLGEHIALPQLIVCGDQSAGKSSVLEGLTGIPFPRQDGLCTRFATEIILQDDDGDLTIKVTLIPHSLRDQDSQDKMLGFARVINSFDELPLVTAEAGAIMGLQGFCGNDSGPAFGRDVLQIQVSGPTGLHLSVVDLPGIVQVLSEEQTDADVDAVHGLVDLYMENPRSIILAVVQAGNDISNQPVVRKCRRFDPSGDRTIGIITKPDLINRGTEGRIALLARNQDTIKLKLGFFLLKNPSPEEM